MELYYTIGLGAIVAVFILMILLTVYLIKDQARLCYRQQALEDRTKIELESFREQVKLFKRESETVSTPKEVKDERRELEYSNPDGDI